MKFRRIVTSISASIDDWISKVENHEAVADCAIGEVRQAAAKIRGQLNTVCSRHQHQQREQARLNEECVRWRNRAIACKDSDEEKALRCMQSMHTCKAQLAGVDQQVQESVRLIHELKQHLSEVELKLHELQGKRDSLSARAARNKVAVSSQRCHSESKTEGVFARWEENVVADEYVSAPLCPTGDLEWAFLASESREALKAELEALTSQPLTDSKGASRT